MQIHPSSPGLFLRSTSLDRTAHTLCLRTVPFLPDSPFLGGPLTGTPEAPSPIFLPRRLGEGSWLLFPSSHHPSIHDEENCHSFLLHLPVLVPFLTAVGWVGILCSVYCSHPLSWLLPVATLHTASRVVCLQNSST